MSAFEEQAPPGVVLVHGFTSSPEVWAPLLARFAQDAGLGHVRVAAFAYDSPLRRRRNRAIPTVNVLADQLWTWLETTLPGSRLLLVGHSQGGLVITRMLARRLWDDREESLDRIRGVVQFGTPNLGSDYYLVPRRAAFFWRNPQERGLRPLDEDVTEAAKTVLERLARPGGGVHIPVLAVGGASDPVVSSASAGGYWTEMGMVPGSHSTMLRPEEGLEDAFQILKVRILSLLDAGEPSQSMTPAETGAPVASHAWAIVIEQLEEKLRLDGWDARFGLLIRYPHRIRMSVIDELFDLTHWLQARILPASLPASFAQIMSALQGVLVDLLVQLRLHLHPEMTLPDGDTLMKIDAWHKHKGRGFNPRYQQEAEDHQRYVDLIIDLTFELTRLANWFADEVRTHSNPTYRLEEGAVQIEGGPFEDGDTRVFRPEFSAGERSAPSGPYVGLHDFRRRRYARDFHTKPRAPNCVRCGDEVDAGATCPDCGLSDA